eukprot:UN14337
MNSKRKFAPLIIPFDIDFDSYRPVYLLSVPPSEVINFPKNVTLRLLISPKFVVSSNSTQYPSFPKISQFSFFCRTSSPYLRD